MSEEFIGVCIGTGLEFVVGGGDGVEIQEQILELELLIRSRRRLKWLAWSVATVSILGVFWVVISTMVLWGSINIASINIIFTAFVWIPCTIISMLFFHNTGAFGRLVARPASGDSVGDPRQGNSAEFLALKLPALESRLREIYADRHNEPGRYRGSYEAEISVAVESMRIESQRYRGRSNWLQMLVIIGSLASTSLAGISVRSEQVRWVTVVTTFLVGVAAGVSGYFKFKERGFYLQQTADAIESEHNQFRLGIGRYGDQNSEEALASLVETVERLR